MMIVIERIGFMLWVIGEIAFFSARPDIDNNLGLIYAMIGGTIYLGSAFWKWI